MRTRPEKQPAKAPVRGTIHCNIQVPEVLHETMKTLRKIRHENEGSDIKLSRLYKEAIEQYINSRAQQTLLNGHATAKQGRRSLKATV